MLNLPPDYTFNLTLDGIIFSLQKHGGISVYFHELLKYLNNQHIQTSLILEKPTLQQINSNDQLNIIENTARFQERYRSCRLASKPQVFHSSYYRLPKQKIPTLVTVHDFTYERFAKGPKLWVHKQQKHRAIQQADAIICVSKATQDDMQEFVKLRPEQKLYVIHNGVSDIYQPIAQLAPSATPFMLYIGERRGYKNFHLLTEAMQFLPDLRLHCVGGGAIRPEELSHLAPSIASRIQHLGFVSDEQLNILYNQAVCLVYPSAYEGFGIPVAEAMRAGCPAVSIESKAVMEVGQEALFVAEQATPDALAAAVLQTLETSERQQKIAQGLIIAQRYSWEKCHAQTVEAYKQLGLTV